MQKKDLVLLGITVTLSLTSLFSSFAGEWKQDGIGWWWQEVGYWGEYPTSQWMLINKKFYYFGADGYMLHDTIQDGFYLGSDGASVIVDIGLPVAPYKAQLDNLIANYLDIYNGTNAYGWTLGFVAGDATEWIDAGSYYIIKNATLGYDYDDYINGGMDSATLGHFDEIYVRKDGNFLLANQIYTLEEWKEKIGWLARTNLIFDDKGYVIGWSDGGAS